MLNSENIIIISKKIVRSLKKDGFLFENNYKSVKNKFYKILDSSYGISKTDISTWDNWHIYDMLIQECKSSNMIYEIGFDTTLFKSQNRKNWNIQLYNDIIVKLNDFSWEYKTLNGLYERCKLIQGAKIAPKEKFVLTMPSNLPNSYGKQYVSKSLPGLCQGYVSWSEMLDKLECSNTNEVRIPFKSFYDIRQSLGGLNLKDCYVVIKKKMI